jgi:hypothetical protein
MAKVINVWMPHWRSEPDIGRIIRIIIWKLNQHFELEFIIHGLSWTFNGTNPSKHVGVRFWECRDPRRRAYHQMAQFSLHPLGAKVSAGLLSWRH